LGDYLDPYTEILQNNLIDNLKEIIQLKKERGDDVILLLGNHDFHYLDLNIYPYCRFDNEIEEAAHALFSENRDLFLFAYQENKHIFTHAGISEKWFFEDFGGDLNKNIAEQLNHPERDQLPALRRMGYLNLFKTGYGHHFFQYLSLSDIMKINKITFSTNVEYYYRTEME
jgi:hypothetical protein